MYEIAVRMGRKMDFPERITLPLREGTLDRIKASLAPDEARVDMIRVSIERELKRRKAPKPKKEGE